MPEETVLALVENVGWPNADGLSFRWVDLLRIDSQFLERFLRFLRVEFLLARELRERCHDDRFRTNLEMLAEVFAVVTASEAVGAEADQAFAQPRRELI